MNQLLFFSDEPVEDNSGEAVKIMKKKKRFYRIGPDGKRELVRTEDGDGPDDQGSDGEHLKVAKKTRKNSDSETGIDQPVDGEEIHMKKKRRFYKIGPDGKRQLIRSEGRGDEAENDHPDNGME